MRLDFYIATWVDLKINGLKSFLNIGVVNNKIAQTKKQNTLKQNFSKNRLFILSNLIIYTTKKSQILKTFYLCVHQCSALQCCGSVFLNRITYL